MIKSIFRLFNFKTIFILVLYLMFKNENKSIRAYEIKEESMKPALLPDEYVLSVKLKEAPKVMLLPIFILSLGTVFSGIFFYNIVKYNSFWNSSLYFKENINFVMHLNNKII